MEPETQQEDMGYEPIVPEKKSNFTLFLTISVLVVVLAAIVFYAVRFTDFLSNFGFHEPMATEEEPMAFLPTGKLYMTTAQANSQEFGIYTYDFENQVFNRASEEFEIGNFVRYTSSLSKNKDQIAYFITPVDQDSETPYPFTIPFTLVTLPFSDPDNWSEWRTGYEFLKSNPSWSPDETRITYEAFERESEESIVDDLTLWGVYLAEQTNAPQRLDTGTYPHWLPETESILYLKTDGLYVFNVSENENSQIIPFESPITRKTSLDVSRGGGYFVITYEGQRIDVYEISSTDPLTVNRIYRQDAESGHEYYSGVISPNGQFVAVVDEDSTNDAFNWPEMYIGVYDIENELYRQVRRIDLDFNPTPILFSEWVDE